MSDYGQAIATIERLRAMGAKRVVVGDVEVEFFTAPHAEPDGQKPPRLVPDEAKRQKEAADEEILFAASG